MSRLSTLLVIGFWLLACALPLGSCSSTTPSASPGGAAGVVVVPIHGAIDMGLAAFIRRVVAEQPDAAAIVLELDTFGGSVDAGVQIRDALLEAKPPVVAYVNHRAISAGALIAYAADTLVFAPGASMGAATPITVSEGVAEAVDEKMTSYMRAEMRATAEANGRRADIAEAMVDRTLAVEGINEAGKLLTLTTEEAMRVGLADSTADSLEALLSQEGLTSAPTAKVQLNWAEEATRFLTDPTVAGILMSLGMLGLMVELYSPGFGVTGALGLLCLSLFFGGHMVAQLAGWEESLMLLGGLLLLGIEVFVTPGFGVMGVSGLLLIVVALALALVGAPIGLSWQSGLLSDALQRVVVSLAGTLLGLILFVRFFPMRLLPNWLVLRTQLSSDPHAPEGEAPVRSNDEHAGLLGQRGEALTDLRLAGKARIGGKITDVVSLTEYIERGAAIEVIEVEGPRVVVARAEASGAVASGAETSSKLPS